MEKIKTVTIAPTTYDSKKSWREVVETIRDTSDNFNLEKMCENCIKRQMSYGVRDVATGELKQTIKCTGLATMKSTLESELGDTITDEFYTKLLGTAGSDALKKAEEFENSYFWIENNIVDPDIFNPRPHQRMINSCTANRKVLRMGRRCVSADTVLVGNQKNYTAKHLWHILKHDKRRPFIHVLDDVKGEMVYTDQYLVLPNGIQDVLVVTLKDGFTVKITDDHPLLVYSNKHYHFVEGKDIEVGMHIITPDNQLKEIIAITKQSKVMTYHISVLKYQTFVTKGGFIHHNTGKTFSMAIGMLHRLLTRKNYEVLMIAPMVTMINEVVEQIKKFCDELPVNPIVRSSQTPINYILFNTGSTFKGVPAGASGAKGARGKSADLMYIDECFVASTKIKMADGSQKAIVDVEEGDYVASFDEKTGKIVSKRVLSVRCTGYKDVYEFKTLSGKKVTSTNNHPVWTKQGWKYICEAEELATLNTKTGVYFYETMLGSKPKGYCKVYNMEVEDTHTYIANGFIVHNCDFLSVKDLNSLLAIINDNPYVELWASSTPIGQGNLYKLGTDPSFKEFHFPTHVVEHYSDEIDSFNRRNLTEIAYEQEVLANYGASEESVFQVKFVDQATYDEESLSEQGRLVTLDTIRANRRNYIITMGVDWNRDKVGTRIVVVAYDKSTSLYHILHKDRVAKLGWTQPLAINKIVENNYKYDVDHVYVDDGHGETQASLLRMFGQNRIREVGIQHPDSRLMDTKAVMFGSSLVLRDPVTGEEIKKQTKQYMVEHTANLLSRGNLVLLAEADNDIVMQLKNYTVKSISARGLKSYEARDHQIGDHDLDAYMLALHAIHQEYSEIAGNSPINTLVSLINNPLVDSTVATEDPYTIIDSTSNIILNTRKSMTDNAFRRHRTKGFTPRKRIR